MEDNDLMPSQRKETRALIIGGGIAGLFAARVLSGYYDQVQIIERDVLPEEPTTRAGVPQSFHLHNLALRGREIIQNLFPGLMDELLERGAFATRSKKFFLANAFHINPRSLIYAYFIPKVNTALFLKTEAAVDPHPLICCLQNGNPIVHSTCIKQRKQRCSSTNALTLCMCRSRDAIFKTMMREGISRTRENNPIGMNMLLRQ